MGLLLGSRSKTSWSAVDGAEVCIMLGNKEWGRQSVVFYDVTASLKTSRF